MLKIKSIYREEWLSLASKFSDYNYEQFFDYNLMCAKKQNAQVENIVITENDEPIALANIRIKLIPFTKMGIAYISGGPLCIMNPDERNIVNIDGVLNALKEEYVIKRNLIVRIKPELTAVRKCGLESNLLKNGFKASKKTYEILVKDIDDSIDNIKMSLTKKWRKELNQCQRRYPELVIKIGSDISLFQDFSKLYKEFLEIKKTNVNLDENFYESLQMVSSNQEKLTAVMIYYENTPISGQISSYCKSVCNGLLGATNQTGRRMDVSYLTQWVIIQYAKEQGCTLYNTWGIDRKNNPSVFYFKSGLNGEVILQPLYYQCVPKNMRGMIIVFAETIYISLFQIIKKLRSH